MFLRNKDLPPTPSSAEEKRGGPSQVATGSARHYYDTGTIVVGKQGYSDSACISGSSSAPPVLRHSPSLGESSSQPTVALARAALGLGLPHVMPGSVSASSSSTDLHALTLNPPPIPVSGQSRPSQSIMRRVKSFQKEPVASADENTSPAADRQCRRSRGLSLGPFQLTSPDKGKERQRQPEPDTIPPASAPKSLARKASFWSRKRVDSHAPSSAFHLPTNRAPRPSLQSLQPVYPSPANSSARTPSPQGSSQSHPPAGAPKSSGLRRRHSERTRSSASLKLEPHDGLPPPGVPSIPLPTPRPSKLRRPTRPQTADAVTTLPLPHFDHDDARPKTSYPSPMDERHPSEREPDPATPSSNGVPPSTSAPIGRPRAATNPPLLHRLSVNLFGSSPTSSTPYVAPNPLYDPMTGPEPLTTSPSSSHESSRPSLMRRSVEIPRPRSEEESPEVYLQRLTEAVSKAEVATVLAASADAFHARALRAYIEQFDFTGDPLDVSLRKLLMDVGLPRETQQIDRVMEAFAARYRQCNPNLFTSEDHPYILAFSLIMLHTDAFNKSNKRKMTKPDYVKNTRLPGVAPEILDCFYDNIVFAPFIFIEDPVDVNGQRGLVPDAMAARRMSTFNLPPTPGGTGSMLLGKSNKIDPYYLIARNLLDDLRVNVAAIIPLESPYMYQGTGGPWDEEELLRAFTMAGAIDIAPEHRYTTPPWFPLSVSAGPGPLFHGSIPVVPPIIATHCSIKVTKVGILSRKDDTVEGGRRMMNRKWREWCVLLTGSQLLFFRDPALASSIQAECNGHVLSRTAMPSPDEYVSVKDSIAVYDKSYSKHPNTLRLVMSDGRQFLLQTREEKEMNEWISRINYASAFKSAGVRMRAMGMTHRDIELTGIAAAASHLRDVQHHAASMTPPRVRTWYGSAPEGLDLSPPGPIPPHPLSAPAREPSTATDSSVSQIESSSRLFKATFDEVKTELAASGRWSVDRTSPKPSGRLRTQSLETSSPPTSPRSDSSEQSRGASRSEVVRRKLRDLESRISLAQTQLDTDMRFVRNLAVLTPFQRATRERVHVAVHSVAKRIMQVRLELEKLTCYRDVLSDDLRAGERDWVRTKKIALRAATDKLALQTQLLQPKQAPEMTLSFYEAGQAASTLPVNIPRTESMSTSEQGQDSSAGEDSFHSAASSVEWQDLSPASAAFLDSRGINESHPLDSPMTSPLETSGTQDREFPFPDVLGRAQASPMGAHPSTDSANSSAYHGDNAGHEKFYTAQETHETPEEQAEEWNKTRAAKRVSLVRLPPDLRISVLFGKHGRTPSESISEATATAPSSPERAQPYNRTGATMDTFTVLDV
ncbi:hypothetical protein WOLCODRAFT_129831 [Wolfiporia cocos MD-104 SS10]|uniref:Uncharacterized protein n=1 Tax=Wolfiporia cocos (strain MD-104) TaxID=742152 RepID=A0A2H3IU96_WOLCO|nr:hypothetical protein WOLCODRAFT_129831 [Wolfiporia cocos MD-104 SS10]